MAKSLSLKRRSKVNVRKDLFDVHSPLVNSQVELEEICSSPLSSIWGVGLESSSSQSPSKSLLLSPDLKRSPKRFSTSAHVEINSQTPKKKRPPNKLCKYSPFRKNKVYSANKRSIKEFFTVKEHSSNLSKSKVDTPHNNTLGIEPIINFTISQSNNYLPNSQNSLVQVKDSLSQTITSSKRCNLPETESTPTKTLYSVARPNRTTPKQSANKLSPQKNTKDVYSNLLLKTVINVLLMMNSDEIGVKLLSDEEFSHINIFHKFDLPSQRLYGRLINRKINWHRKSSLKYGDITLELMLLEQHQFISSDCSNECLDVLLNLLTLPELKTLCKTYKLPEKGVKRDIVAKLISRSKQPSIKTFFSPSKNDSASDHNLRTKLYEQLGCVIKVEKGPLQTFNRCLLLYSYPHFKGLERDRLKEQLALEGELFNLKFPSYEKNCTKVFQSREHFLMYEAALLESSEFLEAIEEKDLDGALKKMKDIFHKLEYCLNNKERREEAEGLPEFLRKFTPGGRYVYCLSSSLCTMRKKDPSFVEECLELLLAQRLYCCHRRGQWYEQLACLCQINCKDNVKASQAVLRGLRDEYVDLVSKHTLCARAAMLEGRKKDGLEDDVKDALSTQRGLVETLLEPESVTISKQVFERYMPGLKRVYIQDTEEGKMLSSVEEVVLQYYHQQGFINGSHDEGATLKSLVFACFWDEIYGEEMSDGHGLFHSDFQTVPLDWNSESFYICRRKKIKSKLQDFAEGGVDAVIHAFRMCFVEQFGTESVVNWKCLNSLEVGESLIQCLDIDIFLNLSRMLLRYHRVFKAGFPDLTLWNPANRKVIFVEVKSPNDHLSIKQKVWLHSLNKMGASALVCHVHSVGCKSR